MGPTRVSRSTTRRGPTICCSPSSSPGSAAIRRATRRCRSLTSPSIAEVTAEPRLYGFHATLKPPMRLAAGCEWATSWRPPRRLADRIAPFDLPPLAVQDVFGFLALRETVPSPPLQALADACVEHLDPFRAPPSEAELARRRRANLTAAAGRDAGPLGLSLRVRHLVLPHDADPPAECRERSGCSCRRPRRISPARSPRRAGSTISACSCSLRPAAPFVIGSACRCAVERGKEARHAVARAIPSFTTVSTGISAGIATLRASRVAKFVSILASARRQPCRQDVRRGGDLDHPHRKTPGRLGNDRARDIGDRDRMPPRSHRPECRSATHAPATECEVARWRIPPPSPPHAPRRRHPRRG